MTPTPLRCAGDPARDAPESVPGGLLGDSVRLRDGTGACASRVVRAAGHVGGEGMLGAASCSTVREYPETKLPPLALDKLGESSLLELVY